MALNIPNTELPGNALLKGIDTGSTLFSRIMQPIIQRENMQRQWTEHLNNLHLQQEAQKQVQARLAQILPYQIQKLKDAHATSEFNRNPEAQFAMMQKMMNLASASGSPQSMSQEEQNIPSQEFQGQGIFPQDQETMSSQMQPRVSAPPIPTGDIQNLSPLQLAIMKKFTGIDLTKETPQQKRQSDLQSRIQLEDVKNENKIKGLQQKEIVSTQKDLPTLEKSLKGVDKLLDIAKNNPDMFGHTFMPDLYAKTSKNKNFGIWQNLISEAIAGLEQKLSSKGNIVALKMASQLKPTHAEQQDVAIGKLESMKSQLEDALNHSYELIGKKRSNNSMDISKMSDAELMKIISGGTMMEITPEMARIELAKRELDRRKTQPLSSSDKNISSIPGDLGDALMNFFMSAGNKAMQLPQEAIESSQAFGEKPIETSGRAAANILGSFLEGGKQLYNLPLNINTYLAEKGIPVFKQTAPLAQKLKIGETGLEKKVLGVPQPGDELFKDIGTVASLIATPEMLGVRVPSITARGIVKQLSADKAAKLAEATKDFDSLFKEAAQQGLTHAIPLKKVTSNQAEIIKNSQPKFHNSFKEYLQEPTIENAHWAQSELGSLKRHLDSISRKNGLTPSQVKTYKAVDEAQKGIKESMFSKNALAKNPGMALKYESLRNKYRENVIPYTRLQELSEVESKQMRPSTAIKGLMNDEEFMLQLSKQYPGLKLHTPLAKKIAFGGIGLLGYDEIKRLLGTD